MGSANVAISDQKSGAQSSDVSRRFLLKLPHSRSVTMRLLGGCVEVMLQSAASHDASALSLLCIEFD